MLRSLVLLSILGCGFGQFFNNFQNGDMMKFSQGKVLEACMGKAAMDEMMAEIFSAITTCYTSPQDESIQLDFSIMPPQAAAMMPADKMEESQAKANAFVSNATCVLRTLEMVTEDGSPNYEAYDTWVNGLDISQELKNGFLEAHELCRNFAECAPVDTIPCPITRRLGRTMAFEKCGNAKYQEACMWEDMRLLNLYTNGTDAGMKELLFNFDNVLTYGDVMKVFGM